MNTKTKSNPSETCETIKLGIDTHAKWFYVARQVDGATPQPVQKMTLEGLLHFVARQQRQAGKVFTCYEAGAFGYQLHRRLVGQHLSGTGSHHGDAFVLAGQGHRPHPHEGRSGRLVEILLGATRPQQSTAQGQKNQSRI